MPRASIVEYFGKDDEGHKCGYCGGEKSSVTHGLWAHSFTPGEYQKMIDRGWRRSGKYCYKPFMSQTCCPQYTIKLEANAFKTTKSQRKVIKKFRNFIIHGKGGENVEERQETMEVDRASTKDRDAEILDQAALRVKGQKIEVDKEGQGTSGSMSGCDAECSKEAQSNGRGSSSCDQPEISSNPAMVRDKHIPTRGDGPDPNKAKPLKAKQLRIQRALAKGKELKPKPNQEAKSLRELLYAPYPSDSKHSFELRMVLAQTEHEEFMETFEESYHVYKKYQVAIHKDEESSITRKQFKRFLCDSSLTTEPLKCARGKTMGGFHQQYVIDGQIICVGVMDILTDCTSSVYLYYDPAYAFLSLGVLSTLFEIGYTQGLAEISNIKNYYMGYYIHSCPKMRYKANYAPSQLLCPVTSQWVMVDKCKQKLDESKFCQLGTDVPNLSINPTTGCPKLNLRSDLELQKRVMIFSRGQICPYNVFLTSKRRSGWDAEEENADISEVESYVEIIGTELTESLFLYRD